MTILADSALRAILFAALVVPVYFGQYWLRTRRSA